VEIVSRATDLETARSSAEEKSSQLKHCGIQRVLGGKKGGAKCGRVEEGEETEK
jgi:hypothetical protein